tara:strand:- start:485 stop:640 length:156 start_codon:yes stop_codon:yes gene_type:complete
LLVAVVELIPMAVLAVLEAFLLEVQMYLLQLIQLLLVLVEVLTQGLMGQIQ